MNGEGRCSIKTGLSFFDHMLEQIARHAEVDLEIGVRGDLKVDEHHTVEDTAIVLGECFAKALGSKKESKDMVLLCLWTMQRLRYYSISAEGLGWNGGHFETGNMSEIFRRRWPGIFASFCQSGLCNLHISAQGENTHHILEAVFKAFARAVRQAIRQTGGGIPSSKGCLA